MATFVGWIRLEPMGGAFEVSNVNRGESIGGTH